MYQGLLITNKLLIHSLAIFVLVYHILLTPFAPLYSASSQVQWS